MNKDLLLKRNAFVKTFVLSNLSERMSDSKLKAVLGGYYSGTCCGDPPEGVCSCGGYLIVSSFINYEHNSLKIIYEI